MMKIRTFSLLFITVLILSCSSPPVERNYYIIDYNPVPNNTSLVLDNPLPYRVQVPDSRVSRVYDRTQIVFRYSAHRIEYAPHDLWAVRLSSAIPDVLTKHFTRYNTFSVTQRDFLTERPDYEVITSINRIEMLRSEYFRAVSISMDIYLRRGHDLHYLVQHSFDREYEIFSDEVEIFTQNLSRIIREETDLFIEKVLYQFEVLKDEEASE